MVGIRRAIALLFLGFYVTQFAMTAALGPDDLFAAYLGLALTYGLAFVGLAAEWFWARWFAIGVGNFGSLILLALFQVGLEPIFVFIGGTHLAIWLSLLGEGMASRYEYSAATAERWNFQEESLILMRRAVKSAGTTIPFLILYTLAPRPDVFALTALGLGVAGLFGMLRGRTWGLLALGSAGVIAVADGLGAFGEPAMGFFLTTPTGGPMLYGPIFALMAGGLMLVPLAFTRPMLRYLKG